MTGILKEDKQTQEDTQSDVEARWAALVKIVEVNFTVSGTYYYLYNLCERECFEKRLVDTVIEQLCLF